jgi:hypothetical protein
LALNTWHTRNGSEGGFNDGYPITNFKAAIQRGGSLMSTTTRKYFRKKRTFLLAAVFYLLIALEFFYMASLFALYFYVGIRAGIEVHQ